MKNARTTIAKAVAITVLAATSGFASAADTQNLNVTASVTAICKFMSSVQTLSFGALDPSNAVDTAGSGAAVTYKCTKGTTPSSVGVGTGVRGNNTMLNTANADLIAYSLTASATTVGGGFSTAALAVTLTSQVLGTAYQDKSAGTYNDTVVLTINY